MTRRPQTRTTTFASGVTETRDARTGELIGYTGLGDDPFVEAPAPVPTLAQLGDVVSAARGGITCMADAYFVELAEEALRRAWAAGDASREDRRDVDNVRFLAARPRPLPTICCARCGRETRMAATEENALQLDNVGWRGVKSGESVGLWCPPCLAGVLSFVEVASKSDPAHPRKVQIRDYKPVSCDCDGFKYRKECSHMKQAAKMVGGGK